MIVRSIFSDWTISKLLFERDRLRQHECPDDEIIRGALQDVDAELVARALATLEAHQ